MSHIPKALLHTNDHEWIPVVEDGISVVGITDYKQESLGDITLVDFPTPGESLSQADDFSVIESVISSSNISMPIYAKELEINQDVEAEPEFLNGDSHEISWLLKIRIANSFQVDDLHLSEAYFELV